jgi:hypothetical protein
VFATGSTYARLAASLGADARRNAYGLAGGALTLPDLGARKGTSADAGNYTSEDLDGRASLRVALLAAARHAAARVR